MALQALCMKCRENGKPTKQDMVDPQVTKNERGRYQARGTCAKCGGNTFAFISEETAKGFM